MFSKLELYRIDGLAHELSGVCKHLNFPYNDVVGRT